jgi:hypothetical protein
MVEAQVVGLMKMPVGFMNMCNIGFSSYAVGRWHGQAVEALPTATTQLPTGAYNV